MKSPSLPFLVPRLVRRPRGGEESTLVRSEDLTSPGTHAVVTGVPGSGKTTLLRHLAYRTAEEGQWFPIFAHLRDVDLRDSLLNGLFRSAIDALEIGSGDRDELRRAFDASLREGRVALFLDGLDPEVSRPGTAAPGG